MIKVGSLFDGIGGTLLSATMCGAEPVWASEIEKFPIEVTKHRFPNVIHLGDITKIDGRNIPPVDIIVGGSPCQDLSVAGNRAGLAGQRSGLFMEQIRIIKEMRDATNGIRPRYMVWENVPGAFSSNNGEDFRSVIEETARIADPTVSIPRSIEGWANSGSVLGEGFSISWRTFDAQYWGVPQRRRRIYLVADFRGQSAPEILFERESVFWDSSESQNEGQGIAGDAESGIRSAGFNGWKSVSGTVQFAEETAPCLEANMPSNVVYGISSYTSFSMLSDNPHSGIYVADTSRTLDQNGGNPACNQGGMIVFENHANDSRVTGPLDVVPTATKRWGTGGGNVPFVMKTQESSYWDGGQVVGTLSTRNANGAQRMPDKQHFNCVIQQTASGKDHVGTLMANAGTKMWLGNQEAFSGDYSIITNKQVRRLTPLECERLQGYPDGWTDIPVASDSARYKALGNSFAIPNAFFVISGCVEVLRE